MLNPDSFSALFSSSSAVAVYGFLGSYIGERVLDHMAEAVEDAFRYGKLVLATTTYNGDIFPFMRTFIDHLTERNFQNRKIALVENGSWAPVAAKVMAKALEGSKNIELAGTVTIRGALKEENKRQLAELAAGLMQ